MNRLRAWLAVAPLIVAGMLVAHAAAYRITGTPGSSVHAYLEHTPQVVLVFALLAFALAGLGARLHAPPAWAFAAAGPLAFVVQEHVERLVHSGQIPWLLTSTVFLLGLALQAPTALVAWLVARWLLGALAPAGSQARRFSYAPVLPGVLLAKAFVPASIRGVPGRGPPQILRP
ncbi:MAG: hypothetical protein R6W48_06565 [Gaiellaceae bacterium]